MLVFAREVFACRCPTDVPEEDPDASEAARRMQIRLGNEADLDRLDKEHHTPAHLDDLRARLASGELWLVGELDGAIPTYVWQSLKSTGDFPSLPGCLFEFDADAGYGYDAWTHPNARNLGLRRRMFLKELHLIRSHGRKWQANVFTSYQVDAAERSIARVGIPVERLWNVKLLPNRTLAFRRLATHNETMRPAPEANGKIVE